VDCALFVQIDIKSILKISKWAIWRVAGRELFCDVSVLAISESEERK